MCICMYIVKSPRKPKKPRKTKDSWEQHSKTLEKTKKKQKNLSSHRLWDIVCHWTQWSHSLSDPRFLGFFGFSRGLCYASSNRLWFFLVCLVSSVISLYTNIYTYIAMYQPYTVYYILYTTMSYYILLCITIDYHIPLYLSVTSTYYMYCMYIQYSSITMFYYVLL